jgi:patatin-like phospholipase/acyl hydrolase
MALEKGAPAKGYALPAQINDEAGASQEQSPNSPKSLLSLDGGGIKGISSLIILQAIMDEIKELEKRDKEWERLPVDYFHLAGGTSTGGLIALMLFRLRMSTTDAIRVYEQLAEDIFSPTVFGHRLPKPLRLVGKLVLPIKAAAADSRYSGKPLKRAIDRVVKQHGPRKETAA